MLDWATARGLREGENPARWKGHLEKLLPAKSCVHKVEHHAALPYAELSAFMAALKDQPGAGARALGFRSTFRDWAAETTEYRSEIVEMALAHTIGNKVEAAYRRGDLFEKRKLLMEDWVVAAGVAERATTPAA